jgi:oligopeptide transport system substrate-binding protein
VVGAGWKALGSLFVAWACVLACSPGQRAPRTLHINLKTEPPTLDWTLATDSTSIQVIEQIMRGLTSMGPDLVPQPALAERWDVSPDGLVYTFSLRRDVVWSDGVPLEASQFVYAWRRLLAPATGAEYAYFLYPVKHAQALNEGRLDDPTALGVRALDRHTLRVELERPLVYFPSLTTFMITFPGRQDLVERHGARWTEPGQLASLGPFVLEEWRHEYRLTLVRNSRYYGPPAALDRIVAYMVEEDSTALVLFEQGMLDIVRLPPLEIRRYRARPEYRTRALLRGYYYGFNTQKPPFDDVRVRRAFAMAIDRSEFPRVLQGGELPATSWLPPGMPYANDALGLRYDPVAAAALLDAAGFDREVPVEVVYNTDQTHKLVAENVQAQWQRNLGVTVELVNREWKVFLKELATDAPAVYRLGWGADYPDPHNFMNLFTATSANNHTGWANARYDEIVAMASRESDPAARQALYDEAQRILCEQDVPIVPFFVAPANFAVAARVRGFEPNPMDIFFFDRVRVE